MIPLFDHFGLRQIENQCATRASKCKDPPRKIGREPQRANSLVAEPVDGEGLPRFTTVHGPVHGTVLNQERFWFLSRRL
jgi:hypothetical protein